jgi:hypothetical protein
MRRSCAILLVLVMMMALLAACTKDGTPSGQTSGAATPQPTPTLPNYSVADFIGRWAVSALYDSSGAALTAEEIIQAGADFTLEFLDGGSYFLYDAQGAPIGQGQYSVAQLELTLNANGAQTVYAIENADTLRCEAEDGSVTVMARVADTEEPDTEETDMQETDTQETETGEPDAETTDTGETEPEETDMDEPVG